MKLIPKGWRRGIVSDLIDHLESGVSVNGEDRKRHDNEPSVLKINSVTYGKFNPDACKPISPKEVNKAKCVPKIGQILITRANTPDLVGASAYVADEYTNLFLPDKIWQTVPRINVKFSMKWLAYYLASPKSRSIISSLASGTSKSMQNITKDAFLSVPLLIPPHSEQQKIVEILSTWDEGIEKIQKLIEKKEGFKKVLLKILFSGNNQIFGERKVCKNIQIKKFLSESKIPSIVSNPKKRLTVRLNLNGIEHREFRGTEAINSINFIRKAGQFIYGKQNFHKGAFGIIPPKFDNYETSQDIPAFDFSEQCIPEWFYYYCSQKQFYLKLESLTTGTGSKRLSPKSFLNLRIKMPNWETQQKIVALLTSLDHEIDMLKQKLKFQEREKLALMKQLLSGHPQAACKKNSINIEEQ